MPEQEKLTKQVNNLSLSESGKDSEAVDPELSVKHPLNTLWTLWFTKPQTDRSETWADLLKPVISFSTVEEFWGIYNNIPRAVELPLKADYHLFRAGIKPEWEDASNAQGGKWSYQYRDKRKVDVDEVWLRAMLGAIGETIEDDQNEVNGVVLNVRKSFYRIGLWTKSTSTESLLPVGKRFKKILNLADAENLEFTPHSDVENKTARVSPSITV